MRDEVTLRRLTPPAARGARWLPLALIATAATSTSSCMGIIGESGAPTVSTPPPPGTPPPGGTPPDEHVLGPAPLRRLNRAEYNNTVRDLFHVTSSPADAWPADGADSGFDNDVNGQGPTDDLIEQVMRSAEQVATEAVAHLDTLLPCSTQPGVDAATCGNRFIDTFGRRAYRRALTTDDRTRLQAVLTWGNGRGGLATGVRLVITAMLQSPHFLYRPEFGIPNSDPAPAPNTLTLGDFEVATRLSYLLTGSTPDDALLDAAQAGQVHTPDQLHAQADRLLHTPAGRAALDRFFRQWLPFRRLAAAVKSPTLFPEWNEALRGAMTDGLAAFVSHVVFDAPRGDLGELMSANYAFVNRQTAPLYGLSGASYGDSLAMVTLTEPRAGLLSQLGVMTALADNYQSSPVARGRFVYSDMLCQPIGAPPANLAAAGVPPPPDPTRTTRERFDVHRQNPACAGCHSVMDPLGFAFESFDAIGRYRATENGRAIDTSGTLNVNGQPVTFDGALALSRYVASSPLTRQCFARKWFTYAFGRSNVTEDENTIAAMASGFGADGTAPVRDFLLSLTQRYAFTHRPVPAAPQECPR